MPPIESSEVLMRGVQDKQTGMWTFVSIEDRIPSEHPLRRIKKLADQRLVDLSRVFNRMYSEVGRPSIAPERILKSLLLIALYSVRSERQFCEQLGYNLLFRWFLDMGLSVAFDLPTQIGYDSDHACSARARNGIESGALGRTDQ